MTQPSTRPPWLHLGLAMGAVLALGLGVGTVRQWRASERVVRGQQLAALDALAERGTVAVSAWSSHATEATTRLAADPAVQAAANELAALVPFVRTDNFIRREAAEALRPSLPRDEAASLDMEGVLITYFHRQTIGRQTDVGLDRSRYGAAMSWWDPRLRAKVDGEGLLDLALVDGTGRVTYTASRGSLLGTHLKGPLADAVADARPGQPPTLLPPGSAGPHGASVAALPHGGAAIVWADLEHLNREIAALGSDLTLLRPDGLAALERAMPVVRSETDPIAVGLSGRTAWGRDPSGHAMAVRPVRLLDQRWAVVARGAAEPASTAVAGHVLGVATDRAGGAPMAGAVLLGTMTVGALALRRRRRAEREQEVPTAPEMAPAPPASRAARTPRLRSTAKVR